jgi:hypothetical protein
MRSGVKRRARRERRHPCRGRSCVCSIRVYACGVRCNSVGWRCFMGGGCAVLYSGLIEILGQVLAGTQSIFETL